MKKVIKVAKIVDEAHIKSLVGASQFNHELTAAMQSGVEREDAIRLIAGRTVR